MPACFESPKASDTKDVSVVIFHAVMALGHIKLLMVEQRIALYQYRSAHNFFQLFEIFIRLRLQHFRHIWVNTQHHVLTLDAGRHLARFRQDFVHHRLNALHITRPVAVRAGRAKRPFEGLLYTLSRDGDQTEKPRRKPTGKADR